MTAGTVARPKLRHDRQCPQAKRGRNARKRGNTRELEIARQLGGEKVGQYQGPEDIRTPLLNVQSKVRKAFPRWMTIELDRLPRTGGRLPALVVTDAPGRGHERETIMVMRLSDFTDLHGAVSHGACPHCGVMAPPYEHRYSCPDYETV